MPLVSIMREKVEEIANLGLKAFAIGAGDKEGFPEGATSVGERTASDQAIPCFLKISQWKLLTLFSVQVSLRIFCRIDKSALVLPAFPQ